MAVAELTFPTTVSVLLGDDDPDAVAGAMGERLPADGIAAQLLPGTRLRRATYRLLDSRILAAAVEILHLDVAKPVVDWLAGFDRLRTAATTTLTDPEQPELTEVLTPPWPVTVTDHLAVSIRIDGREAADVRFTLEVTMELGETSAVVSGGAITAVAGDACSVTASLTLDAWPTPLWAPDPVSLPVRVTPAPPVRIPLVPVPRSPVAAGPSDRARARGRPT
jgi:hypothetical protein